MAEWVEFAVGPPDKQPRLMARIGRSWGTIQQSLAARDPSGDLANERLLLLPLRMRRPQNSEPSAVPINTMALPPKHHLFPIWNPVVTSSLVLIFIA